MSHLSKNPLATAGWPAGSALESEVRTSIKLVADYKHLNGQYLRIRDSRNLDEANKIWMEIVESVDKVLLRAEEIRGQRIRPKDF
jgi:hypothetical protein